jgi:hypothetical protein
MSIEERNAAIIKLLRAHTKTNTRSKSAARAALVALGTHNKDGSLTPEYGGPVAPKRKGKAKSVAA